MCLRAGEIIPQALCTRYGLAIGAYSAWFVWALMWVVGIVSWPISKVLDYLLGSEHGVRIPLLHIQHAAFLGTSPENKQNKCFLQQCLEIILPLVLSLFSPFRPGNRFGIFAWHEQILKQPHFQRNGRLCQQNQGTSMQFSLREISRDANMLGRASGLNDIERY